MDLQERGIHFSVIYTAVRPSRVSNLQCLELSDFYHPIASCLQEKSVDDFQDYTDKQSIYRRFRPGMIASIFIYDSYIT